MGIGAPMMMAASVGLQAAGAASQASAQRNALGAQAEIDANNAQIAEWQAQQAEQNGVTAEQNSRLRTAQVFGAQRAQLAANGVDLGQGSALDVLSSTKYLGERDALTIRDNALRTAWGYKTQATNYLNEADLARSGASGISPFMAGFSTLLGGAGQVASSWYQYKKAGGTVPTWMGGDGGPSYTGNGLPFPG